MSTPYEEFKNVRAILVFKRFETGVSQWWKAYIISPIFNSPPMGWWLWLKETLVFLKPVNWLIKFLFYLGRMASVVIYMIIKWFIIASLTTPLLIGLGFFLHPLLTLILAVIPITYLLNRLVKSRTIAYDDPDSKKELVELGVVGWIYSILMILLIISLVLGVFFFTPVGIDLTAFFESASHSLSSATGTLEPTPTNPYSLCVGDGCP